jgi:AraC-like DNA-binding protein
MVTPQHTVAVMQVQRILDGARHRGMPLAPLLARAGISPALLESPLARVSQQQYALLIVVLRRALRDELWGLCSRPLRVGSFGLGASRLVRCRNLREALREGFRHYHGLIDDFAARLVVQGEVAQVRITRHASVGSSADPALAARLDYAQKAFMLFSHGLANWLVARRVPLREVDYTEANQGSEISRVYQAPIRFNQPHVGYSFDARWLDLPVVQSPQSLREFLAQAPANLLVRYRDAGTTAERIRRLLRRQLDQAPPSLEAIAAQWSMAPQTLRRHLRDEGRGFQQIKDELRRDAAIACLAEPGLTLPEIAQRLGFSEASTFHRAFKKWTGVAPGEYRQTQLGAAASG